MQTGVNKIGSLDYDALIGGNTHPLDTKAVSIATGNEIFKRGTLLNAFGNICTSTDDTPIGILCDDTAQDASEQIDTLMYICGDFKASEIIVGDDIDVMSFDTELQKLGIFLK